MEELVKRSEYESRFGSLKVEGDYLTKWYNERPEKKKQRIDDFYRLKDDVVADAYVCNQFKNSMLSSIEEQVNRLNGVYTQKQTEQTSEQKSDIMKYAPLISFLIALGLGFLGSHLIEKYQQNQREQRMKDMVDVLKEFGVMQ